MARKRQQQEEEEAAAAARVVNVLPVKKKPRAQRQPQARDKPRVQAAYPSSRRGRPNRYSRGISLLGLAGDADVDSEELDEAVELVEDEEAGESYVYRAGDEEAIERSDRSTRSSSARFATVAADRFQDDEEEELGEEDGAVDVEEEGQGEDPEDPEDGEEAAAPVVFQCGTCRSIFGDSYAFVGANADLLLVTLSAVTNVACAPEALTATDGPDAGSSFHEILCKQCQAVLGRQYLTTPIALDALRGLYNFSTAAIASYQLGYPQLENQQEPSAEDAKRATALCDATVRSFAADREELLRLREDMTKVQSLLLVVDERLRSLETEEPDSETDEGASTVTPHSTTGKR